MVEHRDVSPLERFAGLLSDAGVEFIVVGGQAEVLMGRGARPDLKFQLDARAAGRAICVIGLEDLIRIKRHLGRPKDRASLLELEAIQRLRGEEDS